MEVLFFLKKRTSFIRHFYDRAGKPFEETIRKIEGREPPFDNPPYREDDEPPFFAEWLAADTSRQVLGRACLSMLSNSLHVYFEEWESELGIEIDDRERKRLFKKKGFVRGYKTLFGNVLGIDWSECPADLDILEQVTLARNRDQHPERITTLDVSHSPADIKKFPDPFFVSDQERAILAEADLTLIPWLMPPVDVSRDHLYTAIDNVETLGDWLAPKMSAARYPSG